VVLNAALEQAKKYMELNDPRFEWPSIPKILGLITQDWENRAHRPFEPEVPLLMDEGAVDRRRKAAEAAIGEMKELFDNE